MQQGFRDGKGHDCPNATDLLIRPGETAIIAAIGFAVPPIQTERPTIAPRRRTQRSWGRGAKAASRTCWARARARSIPDRKSAIRRARLRPRSNLRRHRPTSRRAPNELQITLHRATIVAAAPGSSHSCSAARLGHASIVLAPAEHALDEVAALVDIDVPAVRALAGRIASRVKRTRGNRRQHGSFWHIFPVRVEGRGVRSWALI